MQRAPEMGDGLDMFSLKRSNLPGEVGDERKARRADRQLSQNGLGPRQLPMLHMRDRFIDASLDFG
ncbi:hypothetical protein [Termitidicoccus mucosus]|uniref:hypothetical protein n=1 Tax=Termitidicoccus mucosus TaxID=1184151 RepID=UPI003CCB87AF